MAEWLSVREMARDLRVRPSNVLGWIASGELEAFNVAAGRGGRPRWRVSGEAIQKFEAARSNRSVQRTTLRRQGRASRRKGGTDVIAFF